MFARCPLDRHYEPARAQSYDPLTRCVLCLLAVALVAALVGPPAASAGSAPPDGFSAPTVLSAIDGTSVNPQVAVGGRGEAIAVWERRTPEGSAVEAATRPARGRWSRPTALSAVGSDSRGVRLAADDKEAVAVWTRATPDGKVVEAATRPTHGTWSAPAALQTFSSPYSSPQPDVGVGANGDAVVIWTNHDDEYVLVESASQRVSGAWSAPTSTVVASIYAPSDVSSPHVAVDANGGAVAVWWRVSYRIGEVTAASRLPGGMWSGFTGLNQNSWAVGANIAVDDEGDATAVWSTGGPEPVSMVVFAASRPAGGAWSPQSALSSADDGWASDAQMAVGDRGDAIAVWDRWMTSTGRHVVKAATRPAAGAWSTPTALSAEASNGFSPQVAVGRHGQAVAVWQRAVDLPTSDGWVLEAATWTAGQLWSSPSTLGACAGVNPDAHVAVGDKRQAVAIWQCSTTSGSVVMAAVREPGAQPATAVVN